MTTFIVRFECPPKWCTYSAVCLLHIWCHVKLLPSRSVLCTPYNHAPCHVSSCKATYVGCHSTFGRITGIIFIYFYCAIAVTRGWNGYRNKSQHKNVGPREENSPCRDSNPRPFDHESGVLTTVLSPLPISSFGADRNVWTSLQTSCTVAWASPDRGTRVFIYALVIWVLLHFFVLTGCYLGIYFTARRDVITTSSRSHQDLLVSKVDR